MPGLPVLHQLPEFIQTHVNRVSDAIQLSHPLSFPSPPASNPSQHQGLFQRVNSSHEVAKYVIRKDAWNDFNFFEFTKARFMAQDVISPGEFHVHLRKRWNWLFWGEMSYRYQLGLIDPLHHLKLVFPANFLFCWPIHRCEWYIKVSHYYFVTVNFPFYTC